jgi:hypothetical protein
MFPAGRIGFERLDPNLQGNRNVVVGRHETMQSGAAVAAGRRSGHRRCRVRGHAPLFGHEEAVEGKNTVRCFRGARCVGTRADAEREQSSTDGMSSQEQIQSVLRYS